jgi:hypothetical protein
VGLLLLLALMIVIRCFCGFLPVFIGVSSIDFVVGITILILFLLDIQNEFIHGSHRIHFGGPRVLGSPADRSPEVSAKSYKE